MVYKSIPKKKSYLSDTFAFVSTDMIQAYSLQYCSKTLETMQNQLAEHTMYMYRMEYYIAEKNEDKFYELIQRDCQDKTFFPYFLHLQNRDTTQESME